MAVLLLIALATVLIVTTSSVTQIERKAVSNSAKEEQARQNALFALQIAVAQLQSAAGPDQRVTATADILNSNSVTPSPVKHPYWTGVWKTFNPAYTSSPWFRTQPLDVDTNGAAGTITTALRPWSTASTNVTWLVSGASNATTVNPLTWTANANNSVLLATNWGTNAAANTVSVPLVTTTNTVVVAGRTITNTGAYAYWVSDEGVKAKVSLTDTNMSSASINTPGMLVSSLVRLTAPAAPNIAMVMKDFGITSGLTSDFRANTNLAKLTSLAGLAFITNGVPTFSNNNLAADLTVWSYGVLCDVRRGGLKQDLTAAMESTSANSRNFRTMQYRSGSPGGSLANNDALMAYRATAMAIPATPATNIAQVPNSIADGLRWQSIYNFYNLYKQSWPQSPYVTNTLAGSNPAGIGPTPSVTGYNSIASRGPCWTDPAGSAMLYSQLTPSVICDAMVVTLGANTRGGTNFFTVSYYPLIVLYNPYAAALNVGSTAFCLTKGIANSFSMNLQALSNGTTPMGSGNLGANPNNLWPAHYVSTTTNTNTTTGTTTANTNYNNSILPYRSSDYGVGWGVTNPAASVMLPGEIRVYGVQGANKNFTDNNLDNYLKFTAGGSTVLLQSSPTLVYGNGYGGVTVTLTNNWQGSTNPADTYTIGALTSAYIYSAAANYAASAVKYFPTPSFSGNYTITRWPSGTLPSPAPNLPGLLGPFNGGYNYANPSYSNTITSLINNPQVLFSFFERIKGTLPAANYKTQFPSYTNNLPLFLGNSMMLNAYRPADEVAGETGFVNYPVELCCSNSVMTNFISVVPNPVNGMATTSWLNGPVGDRASPDTSQTKDNNTQLVLRDIPIAPMTSLGQLMHLEECYVASYSTATTYFLASLNVPLMSIGGSFCSPDTGPYYNTFYFKTANSGLWRLLLDHSFLANEALFDTYFFSTVPPASGFSWSMPSSSSSSYGPFSKTISSSSIAARQPLPNPRHVFYFENGTNPSVSDLQDESKAAANLLLDGAFNVNSTSVAAWKALLTSLNGNTFGAYNYLKGTFDQSVTGVTNPIPRFLSVVRSNPNDPWEGMRSLTDQQVTSLAQEIVKQVRVRGPFLSMGDFLNRRLAPSTAGTGGGFSSINIMGALQQAIENTQTNGSAADVNANVHASTVSTATTPWKLNFTSTNYFPTTNSTTQISITSIATNTATGIPGYLMQQDLVQAFAPVMTVRSDTFVIRVYGRSSRAVGGVSRPESEAWGEAVVQRVPDYFDQADPALASTSVVPGVSYALGDATPPRNATGWVINGNNQNFGRRFKIVSFRWLNQNEL